MKVIGDHIDINTTGKTLVLPTEDAAILPSFNQYVLNSDRLTIAESPFGGLKTGSPDYCPGTLYTPTDGVYLTDVAGNNSTKTLTAGMLKSVNGLTVDPVAHTITEEFIVANTVESNTPTLINDCTSLTGISAYDGTSTRTINSGINVSGTAGAGGSLTIQVPISISADFLILVIRATAACNLKCVLLNSDASGQISWTGNSRFAISANTDTTFILPINAPTGSSGHNPTSRVGSLIASGITKAYIGVSNLTPGGAGEFTLKYVGADVAKSTYIELQTPDNLADSSLTLQAWDGSAYQTTGVYKLDSTYSAVSTTTANWELSDGTKFDDVYGSGLGRALFPKGISAETKAGSTGSITYSANKGTSKRIGFRVDLPPSDGGRTNFNKIRLKTILTYAPDAEDNYSASYDFADSTNTSYGLQNLSKPWIALYDPTAAIIDFYLFTNRPQSLNFKRDETGTIHELNLYPGTGTIYHGQITYSNLIDAAYNHDYFDTAYFDTAYFPDSYFSEFKLSNIPKVFDVFSNGSLAQFLKVYGAI